jgi:spermidine synthase
MGKLEVFMWKINFFVLAACALAADPVKFTETLYPEWGQTFEVTKEILSEKTEHQDLVIFENSKFGRVLALDGIIQLTEADEPVYHEMVVHVPLFTHDNPTSVLIVGGGDGGILRETLKHSSVQRVVLVEIDSSVIELSKKYFPKVSNGGFSDPRVEVVIQDASQFVKDSKESFDVIFCDSSDPIGPSAVLFTKEFYGDCKERLCKDGIFVNMSGVPFLQKYEQVLTLQNASPHFNHVKFYLAPVPSYVGGFMALGFASDRDYQVPEEVLKERLGDLGPSLYYYTPAIHKASFALPNFMIKQLSD